MNTYALISSVASLPTMCLIAILPPGWNGNQASVFSTRLSKMTMCLPSAIRPSIYRRDNRASFRDRAMATESEDMSVLSKTVWNQVNIAGRELKEERKKLLSLGGGNKQRDSASPDRILLFSSRSILFIFIFSLNAPCLRSQWYSALDLWYLSNGRVGFSRSTGREMARVGSSIYLHITSRPV